MIKKGKPMGELFVDLSYWAVIEKVRELACHFEVKESDDIAGCFEAIVNCKTLNYIYTTEENAYRAILAELVGVREFFDEE